MEVEVSILRRVFQFSDDCNSIDRYHSLLICVHADPPVALVGPRSCPHPQMAVSTEH